MMKKLFLALAAVGFTLVLGAVELIHLRMDFSRPGWSEVLSVRGETDGRNGELRISTGSSVFTPYFPLAPGELLIGGNVTGELTLRIHFLRGGNYRDPGTEIGVRTVQTEKDGNFIFRFPSTVSPVGSDGFRIELSNGNG